MENISLSLSTLSKDTPGIPFKEEMIGLRDAFSINIEVPTGRISIKPNKDGNGVEILASMELDIQPKAYNAINLKIK